MLSNVIHKLEQQFVVGSLTTDSSCLQQQFCFLALASGLWQKCMQTVIGTALCIMSMGS